MVCYYPVLSGTGIGRKAFYLPSIPVNGHVVSLACCQDKKGCFIFIMDFQVKGLLNGMVQDSPV